MFDLLLTGGRLIDPAQNVDDTVDIAFADGRVAAIGHDLGEASYARDISGKIVVPGLIDLHTHVYWGGTSLGVDPDQYAKWSGCTTLVDAGSAGPGNIHGFRKHVIEPAHVRVVPFLNLSFAGIFALHWDVSFGESSDLRLLNSRVCLAVAREQADLICGIKVRIGAGTSGALGIAPMQMALEVAAELGLPLMGHLDAPAPPRADVMKLLRAGDILTHCFRPWPNSPAAPDGGVHTDVLEARERGVIFDIGHGRGSFGFETALQMLKNGFAPDVISSDVHLTSIGGPAYNMLITMSKFLEMGVSLKDVIRMSTINPARAARLDDRGTLGQGLLGDATILEIEQGDFTFEDVVGQKLKSKQQIACRGIVLGGKWWHDGG